MSRPFIGIPILNRLDLLEACLAALDVPADVVIANNNTVDGEFIDGLHGLAKRAGAEVFDQQRNLGVSASWNLLVRMAFARGRDWLFIGSNDTILRPGSLAAAADILSREPQVGIWHLHAANFFLIKHDTIDRVGWFDENFYPAYKEDQDYSHRCILAGVRRADVPGAGGTHVGSATVNSDPLYFKKNLDTHTRWNYYYYLCKWGGDATAERFQTPFDCPDKDHRWWPDPGQSIAVRDWDKDRARQVSHASKPKLAVITAVTRENNLPAIAESLTFLASEFTIEWIREFDLEKRRTIGACWNAAVRRVSELDSWVIILDDDNVIHPDFASRWIADINAHPDCQFFRFRQLMADGSPRHTWLSDMKWGRIDAAQFGFKAHLALRCPFQDRNDGPDGHFAEDIAKAFPNYNFLQSEALTWYNKLKTP